MEQLKNKQVAIIGGGPGGLTLATLLQQKGVQVKVYERDKDQYVRQQGATLDLHYNSGLAALGAANLMDEFTKNYRPGADKIRVLNGHGKLFYDEHVSGKSLLDFNSPYSRPEIDRGPLRDMLIASLQRGTIVWDAQFAEMQPNGEGWQVFFKNGTSVYADLVIAADGGNSKVRKYVTGIQPVYSGVTIVDGTIYNAKENVPKLWELTNGGKVFVMGNGKTLWLSSKGDGSLNAYTTTAEPEGWVAASGIDFNDKAQVKQWFIERYAEWSDVWLEIFETDDSFFVPRPQYHFPENQHWEPHTNVTLLGDAAHRTPPSGDGVNQAMLDALVLSRALTGNNSKSVYDAIAVYEQDMLVRAAETTREALDFVEILRSENALDTMLEFFTASHHSE
ncbi:FAD-dependent oxidoreductase [Flavobacterium rhizosphaerae]|uniref:Flavin-dependent monooxygenase n=1 Tax=Flavobacterium rhizosphaerae TaxID=3163298 RepID=A0ABW8YT94_9FLAO